MDHIVARIVFSWIQVVVTDNHGTWVTLMLLLEQLSHGQLLCLGAGVGGLSAYIETTLIAHAYRVLVVVHAVGADQVFRTSWLYASVTADDVVVADTELPPLSSVPGIYLRCRTGLVRPYRTAMNNDLCNSPHDCTSIVELIVVRIVMTIWIICFQVSRFIEFES